MVLVCTRKTLIHSSELWLRQCNGEVRSAYEALANRACRGLALEEPRQGGGGMIANSAAVFRVVRFRSRTAEVKAERHQPREESIPPRLRNKGSISSGRAFFAARASISACSFIKFCSFVYGVASDV